MTHLVKDDSVETFMGLPIEGYHDTWQRTTQESIDKLLPYLKTAFDNGLAAVRWEQYTPGFNDGDICEFGVRTVSLTSDKEAADAWLEDETGDEDEFNYYAYDSYGTYHPDGYTKETWPDVPVDSPRFEDALRSKFGNSVSVVVTPDRVVTFNYEWQY